MSRNCEAGYSFLRLKFLARLPEFDRTKAQSIQSSKDRNLGRTYILGFTPDGTLSQRRVIIRQAEGYQLRNIKWGKCSMVYEKTTI